MKVVSFLNYLLSHVFTFQLESFVSIKILHRHLTFLYFVIPVVQSVNPPETVALTYACMYCPLRLKKRAALYRHHRMHTEESLMGCDECKFFTRQKKDLIDHVHTHFSGLKLTCADCGFSTHKKDELLQHINAVCHQK